MSSVLDHLSPALHWLDEGSGTAGGSGRVRVAYRGLRALLDAAGETRPAQEPAVMPGSSATAHDSVSLEMEIKAGRDSHPALAAVDDLRRWLGTTYLEVARIAGLQSPSIIFHWRRRAEEGQPVRPRAGTVARLYQAHALVRAVAVALDGPVGITGVRAWAHAPGSDGRTPLELLREGRTKALTARSRGILFDPRPNAAPAWQLVQIPQDVPPETAQPKPEFASDAFE